MTDCDAIIIGGGPAGSTAAAILAAHGRHVVLLEREPFPRYHIGESMLPYCYDTIKRLGLVDRLNAAAFTVKKYSVQFAAIDGRSSQPFYFLKHLNNHPMGQTWQVVRSDFDRMLLDNARARGVDVRIGAAAKSFLEDGSRIVGVTVEQDGRRYELRAPITIDCSGRDGFAIHRMNWRKRDPKLAKMALWSYFRGGLRGEGQDEGATTVAYLPRKGWFWHIPLPNDTVSLGIVADTDYVYRDGKDLDAIFRREISENKWVERVMAPATRIADYRVTAEFSYRSEFSATDGLVLAGDAFAFLDPVFSSGVFLALKSGEMVADAAHEALNTGDVTAASFARYSDDFCAAIEAMRKLVYAFYDEDFSFGAFLKKYPHLHGDLTDCLIGHLFKDFTALFDGMSEFADIPAALPHGRPLVTSP